MPAERLVEGLGATDPILGGGVYFGPVLDMKWLTRHPFWPDANPQSNAIPMMLGNTRDETRGFFGPDHPKIVGPRLGQSRRADGAGAAGRHPSRMGGRRISPAASPTGRAEQVFYAATTAGRSWRGQVIEADARARGRRADLGLPARLPVAGRALARRAAHDRHPARLRHARRAGLAHRHRRRARARERGDDGRLRRASPAPAIPTIAGCRAGRSTPAGAARR